MNSPFAFTYPCVYFSLQCPYILWCAGIFGHLQFCFKCPHQIKGSGLKYLKINNPEFTFHVTIYIFIGLLLSLLMIKYLVNHSQGNGYKRALKRFQSYRAFWLESYPPSRFWRQPYSANRPRDFGYKCNIVLKTAPMVDNESYLWHV